jgi:hypothetical protein
MNAEVDVSQNVTQPAQEVVTQPQAETPPWEQNRTETPATQQGTPATTQNDQDEQRKSRGGFQRRIDELVREREYERAEKQRLHDLLARQTGQQTQQPQSESQAQQPPTLEQFDSYEKYLAAYARWEAKAVYEEQRQADQARAQKQQGETRQREIVEQQHRALIAQQQALNKMTSDAERKYPDFYEKVFEQPPDVVPISSMVANAILESEQGMDVAYYLGTHPEDAQRIAKLSPTAQLREFGKLEVSLSKAQSAAPAPINPIGGRQAGNELPSANDDMKTWIAKRNRQLGRK